LRGFTFYGYDPDKLLPTALLPCGQRTTIDAYSGKHHSTCYTMSIWEHLTSMQELAPKRIMAEVDCFNDGRVDPGQSFHSKNIAQFNTFYNIIALGLKCRLN
jgi:hypothetical protein